MAPTLQELEKRIAQLEKRSKECDEMRELLRRSREDLEVRVKERTAALRAANARLRNEIEERKRAESVLRRREKILAAVSSAAERSLRASSLEDCDIDATLGLLGEATGASRVYIFENSRAEDGALLTSQLYEWAAPGIASEKGNPGLVNANYRAAGMGRWEETLAQGEPIVGHVKDFPLSEQAILAPQSIVSILVTPIFVGSTWWGFIGFDECRRERNWSDYEAGSLKTAGAVLGTLIVRKRMEAALRESEETLRATLAASHIGIGFAKNRILKWGNKGLYSMLGRREGSLEGRSVRIAYPDEEEYDRVGRELYSSGEGAGQTEARWITIEGKVIDCLLSISPLDPSAPEKGVVLAAMDITERKRAEEDLRRSEEKYRLVVDNAAEGIVVVQDGLIRFVNPEVKTLWGYEAEDLISSPFVDFIHPEDRSGALERIARRLDGRDFDRISLVRIVDKNGSVKWAENKAVRIDWENRPATLNFLTDITERKEAEEALRESEEKFRGIAERSFDIIFTTDLEGRFTYVSPAVEKLFFRKPEEMLGRRYDEFLIDSEVPRIRKLFEKSLTGEEIGTLDTEVRKGDGTSAFIEINASLVSKSGDVLGTEGVVRDITEHKKADLAIMESERELRFLSTRLLAVQEDERKRIARDLHDSICQFIGFIEFSIQKALEGVRDEQVRKSFEPVLEVLPAADREIRRIIFDLRPSILDDLGVAPAISSLCLRFKENRGIQIDQEITIPEDEVPKDLKIVIYRIVQEALNNVVRHSRADSARLLLHEVEGTIELRVEDDGEGFDLRELQAREDPERGLGLTGMKERTELSGGTFRIETGVGAGTRIVSRWAREEKTGTMERDSSGSMPDKGLTQAAGASGKESL